LDRVAAGSLISYMTLALLLLVIFPVAISQAGNAGVIRIRNQQYFELNPNNSDITKYRNLQDPELRPNGADLTRHKNVQSLELAPNNADMIRFRNLQCLERTPNNADVIRYRNLMSFQLGPNDADVKRFGNLQYFQLKPLLYEYDIAVTSLVITDQAGTPATNFLRGEIVQFDFIIENLAGPEHLPLDNGLITITVLDPSTLSVFLSYTYEDLPRGATAEFVIGYRIPTDGATGTYTVKVMVLTDWPSNGGLGLTIEESVFNVS